MAVLSLRFCARAFSSCGKRGGPLIAVREPLTIAASLVAEHRLQTRRLSSCGLRAQLLHSTGDLPRPGLEPVSPASAGRLPTTAPPGKPLSFFWPRHLQWKREVLTTGLPGIPVWCVFLSSSFSVCIPRAMCFPLPSLNRLIWAPPGVFHLEK